ncbi:hypothetical protein ACWTU6_30930 [Mesorhizobium sp. BHbsci]
MALEDRREILAEMIPDGGRIQFSQALPGEAKAIFHLIDQAGLEGMVSRRKDSKHRSGNSTAWLKTRLTASMNTSCSASSVNPESRLSP